MDKEEELIYKERLEKMSLSSLHEESKKLAFNILRQYPNSYKQKLKRNSKMKMIVKEINLKRICQK